MTLALTQISTRRKLNIPTCVHTGNLVGVNYEADWHHHLLPMNELSKTNICLLQLHWYDDPLITDSSKS